MRPDRRVHWAEGVTTYYISPHHRQGPTQEGVAVVKIPDSIDRCRVLEWHPKADPDLFSGEASSSDDPVDDPAGFDDEDDVTVW